MKLLQKIKERIQAYQRERRERNALTFANQIPKKANKRGAENFFVQARVGNR